MDVLLAALLAGSTVATLLTRADGPAGWLPCMLGVLTTAPLALRQRAPLLTMAVIVAAVGAYVLLGFGSNDFPNGGISLLVGMFTVAALRPRRVAAVVFLVTLSVTLGYLTTVPAVVWSQAAQAVLVLVGAWMLGEGTRRWGQRTEQLAAQAATAVADERVRIARELHDIVAHHMSVVSLQAGLAQYVLDTDLPTARDAIIAAGGASRDALSEMRRLLDVLRVDHDADSSLSPQPGLAKLDELAKRTRSAGLPVDVVVHGNARLLLPGPDLCAYRVVQESLTNVLKHAGPATARIDLDYGLRTLTVMVTDDGVVPRPQLLSPNSHGIRGMRERAELYGGSLTAGPLPQGGFAVVARLPMGEGR